MRRSLLSPLFLSSTVLLPSAAHTQTSTDIMLDPVVIQSGDDIEGVTRTTAEPVQGYRALTAGSATRTDTPVEELPQNIQIIPQTLIEDQVSLTVIVNTPAIVTPLAGFFASNADPC